jgi:hypothetical protein
MLTKSTLNRTVGIAVTAFGLFTMVWLASAFRVELGLAKSYASSNFPFNVGVLLPINLIVLLLSVDVLYDLVVYRNIWTGRIKKIIAFVCASPIVVGWAIVLTKIMIKT